ncbi:MAG TPA: F0F1 ATP synthase subunit B [Candidatus Limnocylindrales bacterium]|nr:F0F1 ATP synthase subunit B [Candidatus Limnocylindrales bacterium]
MDVLSVEAPLRQAFALAAEAGEEPAGFQINLFWVLMQALSFLLFLAIIYLVAFRRIGATLEDRRARIEQGLRDAEQARRDREQAEQERLAALAEARREANEILARAQRVAQETREADIAATREELTKMREQASAEIAAQQQKAIEELRAEVADLALAAAGRVVRESMTDDRQRRLVNEFLAQSGTAGSGGAGPATGGSSRG